MVLHYIQFVILHAKLSLKHNSSLTVLVSLHDQ